MNLKGCAFVLMLLLLAVLAYSLLNSNLGTDIPIPTFKIPTLGNIGTLPPILSGTLELTPGTPARFPTPTKAVTVQPAASATPSPVQNGKLLFLGFDQAVWSTNPDGSGPIQLGFLADFQLTNAGGWHSPDGKYALLARVENGANIAYLTAVDGTQAVRMAPILPAFDFGAPRDIFAFSTDSSKFFFLDASANPANLMITDLKTNQTFSWPIQASSDELTYAAFAYVPGSSTPHLVLKSFDPAINGHYLEMFDIGATLTNPKRTAELRDHRIEQFAVSPNGRFAAIVYRSSNDPNASDELYALDFETGKQVPFGRSLLDMPGSRILLIHPAWSSNDRYLLENIWTFGQPATFDLVSNDLMTGASKSLVGSLPSQSLGLPLGRVFSYSPDGGVAGIYLYGAQNPKSIDFYRIQLDGSQTLKITSAQQVDNFYQGEFISAIASDWSKMLLVSQPTSAAAFPNTGNLYSTWLDGNGRTNLDGLVPLPYFDLGPVISPDGKETAYMRLNLTSQQAEFVISDLDGKNKRILFTGAAPAEGKQPVGLPLVWLPHPR